MKKSVVILSLLAFSLAAFGCSDEEEGYTPNKSDARDDTGKADSGAIARMCEKLGYPSDCDICEAAGWYGDGTCDDFCRNHDSDCMDPDCESLANEISTCYENQGSYWDCYPEDDDAEAKICCEEQGYDICGKKVDEGECDVIANGVVDCIFDGSLPIDCFPDLGEEPHAAACCAKYDYGFCGDPVQANCEFLIMDFDACVNARMNDETSREEAEESCMYQEGSEEFGYTHDCCFDLTDYDDASLCIAFERLNP